MKVLCAFFVLVSFNAFAGFSSTEPKVNFKGTKVEISKTCLTEDGQHLRTQNPVKRYGHVLRGGKVVSVYLGKSILETNLTYVAKGRCLIPGPKTGTCSKRAPSVAKTYELNGSYDVFETRVINGKYTFKEFLHSVIYSVPACL